MNPTPLTMIYNTFAGPELTHHFIATSTAGAAFVAGVAVQNVMSYISGKKCLPAF